MENKMEEELRREEKEKNKTGLYIVAGVFLLLIVFVITFRTLYSRDNNEGNTPIINNSTLSDDATASDDKTDTIVDKKGNELYIYQKGYSDMAPIAFTYECKSENCNLFTTEKGFVLYDEDKVQYREMTQYEYEQINNSDKSPNGEELDKDGFKEATSVLTGASFSGSVKNECDDCNLDNYKDSNLNNVYEFDNHLYYLLNDEFNTIEYFKEKNNDIFLYDSIIFFNGTSLVYDYEKKQIIFDVDKMYEVGIELGEEKSIKTDYFTILYVNDAYLTYDFPFYIAFDNNYNSYNFVYEFDGFYYNEKLLYFIDENNLNVIDSEGNSVKYDNTNMKSLFIFDDNVAYLDENNILKVKNINSNKIKESNFKVKNFEGYNVSRKDNEILLYIHDDSVIEESEFDNFRIQNNISDNDFNKLKKCINESCDDYLYEIGYVIKMNKSGEVLSDDYHLYIYQDEDDL